MPLGAHGPHQIAAGFVDGERGIDVELLRHQLVDDGVPLVAARRRGLLPEAAGLAKAIALVVVVVARRIVLNGLIREERFRQAVPMLHAAQSHARGVDDVGARHAHLREVGGAAEVELVGFVDEGGEDFRVEDRVAGAEDFDSVRALLRNPLHELARLFRAVDRTAVPLLAIGEDVGKEPRCDDLVARAAVAFVQTPIDAVAASRLAHAGDAVRHPQLEHVLGGRPLLLAAGVAVHVDESGEHPDARAVDLLDRILRPGLRLDGHLRKADAAHFADAVAFDDDVHRSDRRRSGAVDERDRADDEPRPRPFAFVAIGCEGRWGGKRGGG